MVVCQEACRCAQHTDGIIWFETVSSAKAVRATEVLQHLAFASPNVAELIAMSNAARRRQGRLRIEILADGFAGSRTAHAEISRLAPHIQTLLEVILCLLSSLSLSPSSQINWSLRKFGIFLPFLCMYFWGTRSRTGVTSRQTSFFPQDQRHAVLGIDLAAYRLDSRTWC